MRTDPFRFAIVLSLAIASFSSSLRAGDGPEREPEVRVSSETGAALPEARVRILSPVDLLATPDSAVFPPPPARPVPLLYEVRAPGHAPARVHATWFPGRDRPSVRLEAGVEVRVLLVDGARKRLRCEEAFALLGVPTPAYSPGWTRKHSFVSSIRIPGDPDDRGGFRLRDIPLGEIEVGVRLSPSVVMTRRVPIREEGRTALFLRPPTGRVSGKVTDADGRPVSGCHVSVRMSAGTKYRATANVRTNEAGSYSVVVPAGQLMWTEFLAPGHGPARVVPKKGRPLPPEGELTVSTRLPAEWRLEGRLLHADTGKPVVGMYVRARGESRRWRASAVPVGLTDAEGRFLMRGLAPGTVTIDGLSATHCLPDRVVSSEEFGDAPVTLRVPPPGSLRGRVVGPRGGPAAGVFVDVRRNGRIVAGLRTGLTGEFTMRRVPAGPAELLVRSPDHRPMSQYVFADVPVTNGEVIRREGTAIPIEIPVGRDLGPIRVKARDLVVLGGRAVDPDGRGVAGLKILIRERHVPFWLPVARLDIRNLGRSGPGGLFRVAVPRPIFERDLLCLHRPGLVVTHLQKAGEDLEIRLGRGCRLTARVLDRSRRPLWGRSFRVSPEYNRETHGTWKQRAGFPVETDLDGRFTLPGLPPGEYHLAGPPNLAREIFVIDGDLERDFVLKPR